MQGEVILQDQLHVLWTEPNAQHGILAIHSMFQPGREAKALASKICARCILRPTSQTCVTMFVARAFVFMCLAGCMQWALQAGF